MKKIKNTHTHTHKRYELNILIQRKNIVGYQKEFQQFRGYITYKMVQKSQRGR